MKNTTEALAAELPNVPPYGLFPPASISFIGFPPPFYPQSDWNIYTTQLYYSQVNESMVSDQFGQSLLFEGVL